MPSSQVLNLADVFAQDTVTLTDRLKLTVGLKLEDEPYAGLQPMPSVRASWKAFDSTLLWAAVSRAVRSPTPVDENLREYGGPVDFLNGSTGFRPETLTAYEFGTRVQATPRLSFSVSTYYDVYDDLRTHRAVARRRAAAAVRQHDGGHHLRHGSLGRNGRPPTGGSSARGSTCCTRS